MPLRLTAAFLLIASSAVADDVDLGGELNPPEMGIDRVLRDAQEGRADMVTCASGYYFAKKGDHKDARAVFEGCADAGYAGAMTWMSQLVGNGLGGPADPATAADWNRRAAAAGDPIGQFNHGLDLLRGDGVERDEEAGRRLVDQAAAAAGESALAPQAAGYDPRLAAPDAGCQTPMTGGMVTTGTFNQSREASPLAKMT